MTRKQLTPEQIITEVREAEVLLSKGMNAGEVCRQLIEPGTLWENGYNESSNGKLGDELLNRAIFYTLWEAKVL